MYTHIYVYIYMCVHVCILIYMLMYTYFSSYTIDKTQGKIKTFGIIQRLREFASQRFYWKNH